MLTDDDLVYPTKAENIKDTSGSHAATLLYNDFKHKTLKQVHYSCIWRVWNFISQQLYRKFISTQTQHRVSHSNFVLSLWWKLGERSGLWCHHGKLSRHSRHLGLLCPCSGGFRLDCDSFQEEVWASAWRFLPSEYLARFRHGRDQSRRLYLWGDYCGRWFYALSVSTHTSWKARKGSTNGSRKSTKAISAKDLSGFMRSNESVAFAGDVQGEIANS